MDRVSKATRSRIMASVRSKGNRTTEALIGRLLWANGFRGYRKHWHVSGKPDFAWPGRKIAIFVDGCFWHGCPRCDRPSKSNLRFWRQKISGNRNRDARVCRQLRKLGWKVIRIWECAVSSPRTLLRIQKLLVGIKNAGGGLHA